MALDTMIELGAFPIRREDLPVLLKTEQVFHYDSDDCLPLVETRECAGILCSIGSDAKQHSLANGWQRVGAEVTSADGGQGRAARTEPTTFRSERMSRSKRIKDALQTGSESQLLKALVEGFPGSWFFTRSDGTFAYVNEGAGRELGYTQSELLALTIFDVNPTVTPESWSALAAAAPEKRQGGIRTIHRRKDGSTFPVEACGIQTNLDGEAVALAYVVDLSDEAEARRQLAEREHLLQTVLRGAPVALFSLGADGRIQAAEGSALVALGVCQAKTANTTHREVFAHIPQLIDGVDCALGGQLAEGRVQVQGSQLDYKVHPVCDEKGAITGVVGVATDVTRRVQAEADARRLHARLAQAKKMEAIGRLAAGIAHDFNNLIQAIGAGVETCLTNPSARNNDTLFLGMQDACERAARMVAQLLTVGPQVTTERVRVDWAECVSGMMPMLQQLMGERIELTLATGNGPGIGIAPGMLKAPCSVVADPVQLEQLLLNLCVNARDAIEQRGRVALSLRQEYVSPAVCPLVNLAQPGNYVVLEVSDTGRGMSPEVRSQAFEPFFTTKGGEGSGLGLATVYAVVQRHEGAIELDSEEGVGTRFRVYLPSAPAS